MGGELVLLKHDDLVGPGWLLDRCVDRVDFFRVVKVTKASDLPPPNECNGVVFTSHTLDPATFAAKDPLQREEVIFVRTLLGLGVPFLGIDGGAQLLVRAILGKVVEARSEAMGPDTLALRDEAVGDPLFGDLPELPVIRWPTHRVTLPSQAIVLAGSDDDPALFRARNWTYGVFPHIQATPLMFSEWLGRLPHPPPEGDDLVAAVQERESAQKKLAFTVMNRFIERTSCFCHDEPPVNDQSTPLIPL
jgi:GMP synthase-like glutamine amidotransferase